MEKYKEENNIFEKMYPAKFLENGSIPLDDKTKFYRNIWHVYDEAKRHHEFYSKIFKEAERRFKEAFGCERDSIDIHKQSLDFINSLENR